MMPLTRQQAIGLCLLLLISSNEGMRVNNKISVGKDVRRLSDTVAKIQKHVTKEMGALQDNSAVHAHSKWITGWFSNFEHSACPPDMNIGDIAKRFAKKSEKLQATANSVKYEGLVVGAGLGKIRELVGRAKGLAACSAAEEIRPELKDLVEDPDSGVQAQLSKVYQKFIATANASSLTSWEPDPAIGCTMDLKLELLSAPGDNAEQAFQKSFYGESCDVAAYKAKQPAASRHILERIHETLKKVSADFDSGKGQDEITEKLFSEAEQHNDDDAAALSSLMELSGEVLEEQLSAIGAIFVCLYILMGFLVMCYVASGGLSTEEESGKHRRRRALPPYDWQTHAQNGGNLG